MKILLVIFLVVVSKIAINKYALIRLDKLKTKYEIFISNLVSDTGDHRFKPSIFEMQPELIQLFTKANIIRPTVSVVIPLGYNQIKNSNPDVWDNMFVNNKEIITHMYSSFSQANGVFKLRLKNTLNPLYWIESIVFLPQNMLKYLGVKSNSIGAKILNFIYWTATAIYAIYNEFINDAIQNILSSILK